MYKKFKISAVQLLILNLFLAEVLPQAAFAYCETDKFGLDGDFCHVIDAVERDRGCGPFKNSVHGALVYNSCISLMKLKETGSCKSLRDTESVSSYIICNEIMMGMDSAGCNSNTAEFNFSQDEKEGIDAIVSSEIRHSMCEFGRHVKRNYSSITDARNQALMAFAVEMGLMDHSDSTESLTEGSIQRLSEALQDLPLGVKGPKAAKTREQEIRLGTLILRLMGSNQFLPLKTRELAGYVRNIIFVVEKYRHDWVLEARDKQARVSIEIGENLGERGDRVAPSNIQISNEGPDGKVVVFLDKIMINNKVRVFKGLGKGAFKDVERSFDYDLGVSSDNKKASLESAFVASGNIKNPRPKDGKERKLTEAEQIENNIKELTREFKIQSLFIGKTGIATAGRVALSTNRVNPSKNKVVTTQTFYPYDLPSFMRYLNSEEIDTIEGLSKDIIKMGLAMDLLTGLKIIHEEGIHHRDIKPENIFVGFDEHRVPRAFIADFGIAFDTKGRAELVGAPLQAGTTPYMSPEMHRAWGKPEGNENLKNDVWAMGLVLYYIYSGKSHELPGQGDYQYISRLGRMKLDYSELKTKLGITFSAYPPAHDTFEGVIYSMLNPDVTHRPSAEEAWKALSAVWLPDTQKKSTRVQFHLGVNTQAISPVSWDELSPVKTPSGLRGVEKIQLESETRLKKDADSYAQGILKNAKSAVIEHSPSSKMGSTVGTKSTRSTRSSVDSHPSSVDSNE